MKTYLITRTTVETFAKTNDANGSGYDIRKLDETVSETMAIKLDKPMCRLTIEFDDNYQHDCDHENEDDAKECARLVEVYGVYGFIFEIAESTDLQGNPQFEHKDSCWGFAGYKRKDLIDAMFDHISLPDGIQRADVTIKEDA